MNFELIFIEFFEYFLPFQINRIANFLFISNKFQFDSTPSFWCLTQIQEMYSKKNSISSNILYYFVFNVKTLQLVTIGKIIVNIGNNGPIGSWVFKRLFHFRPNKVSIGIWCHLIDIFFIWVTTKENYPITCWGSYH